MTWTPSPALRRVVQSALVQFHNHWPRAMSLATDTSEQGAQFIADYARPMLNCDLDAITEAAAMWLSENNTPPRPAEFAKLAREITRERRPQLLPQYGAQPSNPQELPQDRDFDRIDVLGKRAFAVLGSWQLVSEVWSLLYFVNQHPDYQAATRAGNVPYDVFDTAIASVKRGERAPSGPLHKPSRRGNITADGVFQSVSAA